MTMDDNDNDDDDYDDGDNDILDDIHRNVQYVSQWNTEVKFTTILSNRTTIVETNYIEYRNESCSYSCHHMYGTNKTKQRSNKKKNILTRCAMICKKKMLSMSLCQIEQAFIYIYTYTYTHTRIHRLYIMCANKGEHTVKNVKICCNLFFSFHLNNKNNNNSKT